MLAMLIVFQELSKSLQSEKGKMYAIKCDVSKEYDIETAFKWVKDNLGGVDILINNAAIGFPTSLIGKTPRQLLVVLIVCFLGVLDKAKSDR
jgi:NAD(P)-dependent dehydrogenase (short-subunit alcohol dehydrogenase family)